VERFFRSHVVSAAHISITFTNKTNQNKRFANYTVASGYNEPTKEFIKTSSGLFPFSPAQILLVQYLDALRNKFQFEFVQFFDT